MRITYLGTRVCAHSSEFRSHRMMLPDFEPTAIVCRGSISLQTVSWFPSIFFWNRSV